MKSSTKETFTAKEMLMFIIVAALLGCLLLGSVYLTVTHTIGCVDVIRYTVPARSQEAAEQFSLVAYLREVGVFNHISGMPQSAKVYFVRDAVAAIVCAAIAVATVVVGVLLCRRYKKWLGEDDPAENDPDPTRK